MKKVTILGGGIAGIEAAIYCRKVGFDVELISDRDYLFIYPISIWIPVSTIPFEKVQLPLSKIAQRHGFALTIDRVMNINGSQKKITLEKQGERSEEILILATGAGKMKHQGLEHTLSICGEPSQSLLLKEQIDALIAKGSGKILFGFGGNPKDTSAVRGGPGFELFFNLHNRLKTLGIRQHYEMTFFAPMPQPGARMGEKALSMMKKRFDTLGFSTHYGKKIARFEPNRVVFEDDVTLEGDLIMFIPAGSGSELIATSDLPKNDAGFVKTGDDSQIVGIDSWYAIGDVAALEGPEWRAKQGHVAEIMARNAAQNLARTHLGKTGPSATYTDHLSILCLMDMGDGAGFVFRNDRKASLTPLPIIGHWFKRGWGHYYKLSKLRLIPRLPGL